MNEQRNSILILVKGTCNRKLTNGLYKTVQNDIAKNMLSNNLKEATTCYGEYQRKK